MEDGTMRLVNIRMTGVACLLACVMAGGCGKDKTSSSSSSGSTTEPSPAPTPTPSPTPTPTPSPVVTEILTDPLSGRQVFPTDNWWNLDVSRAPIDSNSANYINFIGRSKQGHPDFAAPPYGVPYYSVSGSQTRVPVTFVDFGSESDPGINGEAGYPIPDNAKSQAHYIEGDTPGGGSGGDDHMIIIDRDKWLLFELYQAYWNQSRQRWEAGSGAIFNLATNGRRPEGWTSADAAGLAIFPGLVRYDEAVAGTIKHAFRTTVRSTNGYVWPASHQAGGTSGALPLGARLRLKASKDISGYPSYIQNIFQAMKTYGLIVADNGTDMYVTGTMDSRWNNFELNPAFKDLTPADFDVIQLGWR